MKLYDVAYLLQGLLDDGEIYTIQAPELGVDGREIEIDAIDAVRWLLHELEYYRRVFFEANGQDYKPNFPELMKERKTDA